MGQGTARTGHTFRRPVDMAVVIDASGSMSARGKIDYAKRAAKLIASEMNRDDTFSLIAFNDEATTVISGASISDDPSLIHRQIDRIYEGGGTNLFEGMARGASEVERVLDSEAVGRVVILSDGHANVGVTDVDSLTRYAATIAAKSPLTVRGIKKVSLYTRDHPTEDALAQVGLWNAAVLFSEDLDEATKAMMEKRAPAYRSD